MKICIPTQNDRGPDSEASDHFGKAPFFVLADVDNGGLEVVRNPECHEQHHSCHHVQVLKAHAVDAVLCSGIGRRALAGLTEAGIEVLAPAGRTVSEIVETVKVGKVRSLSPEDVCGGGGRHQHHGRGEGRGHRHGHGRGRDRSEAATPAREVPID
jgi:predicted Fe-Mo cluster-binding NifX family protein